MINTKYLSPASSPDGAPSGEAPFGVSAKDGLKMLGNNTAIYLKLLKRYAENTIVAELTQALEAGDLEAAAAKAHALKGVSANLCLNPVYEQSKVIDAALKEGVKLSANGPEMALLKEVYDKTLASIQDIAANPAILDAFKG